MTAIVIIIIYLTANTTIWLFRHRLVNRAKRHTAVLNSDYLLTKLDPPPTVSMIVAARNESDNIERCVTSLLNQNYENLEIIAVNDRSEDDTGVIIDRLAGHSGGRLKALHVEHLPEGWLGKPNAMRLAVEHATGEYLCFTDADCDFICPETIRIAVQLAHDHAVDLLSILPVLETSSFWERVLQPVCSVVLMAWFRPEWVNCPTHPRAYANGAFMLFRRACYDAIGGHVAAKTKVNEDMEFARLAKAGGHRLHVIQNGDLYRTRMYEDLRNTFRGWSRIFYGCFARVGLVLAAALMLTVMTLLPYVVFLGALVAGWREVLLAAAVAIVAQMSLIIRFYRLVGLSWLRAASYPLGALIVLAMLISAAGKFFGGTIIWRGRQIAAGRSAA